ncbi:MAG: outer membrane beta-barrel protein [Flavobacteriales bacterium]|nr:outer membrane beta-barrel protein [Flavobacteriales bacterium]
MHRRLLILYCLLALPGRFHSAFAQHSGIGIKGGLLLSDTRSAKLTSNTIPGATAGAYFALRAGDRLEVQPELLLTSLGSGYTLPDGERATVRTLYIQMPVCAKAYVGNTFNAQGGILMGRLMLAQQETPNGTEKVTDSYNNWDYGFVLGVGADRSPD